MAGFLTSSSVSLANGSKTVNLTGSVNCSSVVSGTAVYINGELFEGVAGTASDPSGNSTITLRNTYTGTSITGGTLVAFNTIEGLRDAIQRARDLSAEFQSGIAKVDSNLVQLESFLTETAASIDLELPDGVLAVEPYNYLRGRVATLESSQIELLRKDDNLSGLTNKPLSRLNLELGTSAVLDSGSANGVASLDINGKVPLSQINDSVLGQVEYKGLWNPSGNTPTLPTTPTEKGHYYICSTIGTQFGITFATGDWIISSGTEWGKVDNTDAVSSVQGRTGNVVLTADDIDVYTKAESDSKYITSEGGLLSPFGLVPVNGGVWVSGQTFTAYNQYMIYNGEAYSPLPATVLPYPVGAIPDLGFVYQIKLDDHSKLANLNAVGGHDAIYSRTYATFASLLASPDNLVTAKNVKTSQHTNGGIGGTTYVKDGTTGAASTGNEAKFFDAQGNGWINKSRDVTTYGAITDDIAVSAQKAIDQFNCVYIPTRSDYVHKAATITLKEGSCINTDNPLITTDGINFNTFILADDITRWAILGAMNYKGSLVTGADVGAEIGLQIKGCTDYRVENFVARNCRSHSIKVEAGTLAPSPRGDQGQLVNCAGYECRIGVEVQADTTAEFNQFVNFNAAGCIDGIIIGAGNTSFVGGNCVDNTKGLTVVGGPNHAHGIVSGMNINHNPSWNIKCVSVTNGHTFDACHAYGNGGTTAPVWFENSKNCTFQNGVLDCPVYNDGTAGQNAVLNNNLTGNDAQSLGTNPEMLRVLGNWNENGAWDFNDAASEYSLASSSSTQLIPNGTVLIFDNAIKDKRAGVNLTTGVYTAPIAATYDLELDLVVTGTFTDNGYLEILVNNVFRSYVPAVKIGANVMQASISTSFNLAQGDNVRVRSQILSGTNPVLGAGSQMKVAVIQ